MHFALLCACGGWPPVLTGLESATAQAPATRICDVNTLLMPCFRYCVEAPANICTPAYLADVAEKIAAIAPERFNLKVLLRPEVEAMKMGLYLGVAEASETGNDLRFIHLTYKPKGQAAS